jgi:pyruvate formate lyase activating enzyme
MALLAETLERRSRAAALAEPMDHGWVRCVACGHACRIPDGGLGVCKVRFNRQGILYAPWGYAAGVQCDPIEKKPFFHAWPGSLAYSFGMLGCDLHCSYCQNWITSQALRDPCAVAAVREVDPARLVLDACASGARAVVSTYNEPLITSEWAVEIFRQARQAGLGTGYVSNGHGTPQVVNFLAPWIDVFKIDLKSFRDREYRKLGGRLAPVLDTIVSLNTRGIWLEIVTLLVPGLNDDPAELRDLTGFLARLSPDIPWHVTAFHPAYKMSDAECTTASMLAGAVAVGREAGLRFVYAGNLPGQVASAEDTRCPTCRRTLVQRRGYRVLRNELATRPTCPGCATVIPGRWT